MGARGGLLTEDLYGHPVGFYHHLGAGVFPHAGPKRLGALMARVYRAVRLAADGTVGI